MFHFDFAKLLTTCLVAFTVAGSTYLNLKTKAQARDQQDKGKELLVALVIYGALAGVVMLLCASVWTGA